jgi:hypothetical protein
MNGAPSTGAAKRPLAMNKYCYLPTPFFSRQITKMQLVFEWRREPRAVGGIA